MEATTQNSEHRYFDLWLERDRAGVSLVVTNSPAGQSSAPIHQPMPAPFDSAALEVMGMAELVALGSALWSWLFAARDAAELWRSSCNGSGSPLLRLTIGDAQLAAWPWELLYDSGAGRFVALEAGSGVVRRLPLPLAVAPEPAAAPVRVLFTGSSPAELPPMDLAPEWRTVEEAASQQGWTLAGSAGQGSLGRLAEELSAGAQVWHFAGHGAEDALLFSGDDGRAHRADALTVGALLAGAGVRVAVVNACRAGAGGGAAASIAGALLRAGVPVVVAMQAAVPDAAALAFSRAFYRALALGKSVELAATEGRRAMLALGQPLGASWWMPVLTSRAQGATRLVSPAVSDASASDAAHPPATATGRSAISQGGVAISGQVGGSVVLLSTKS